MKNCEECGKKLGFLEGYRHPILGWDHLLCRHCFDKVSESVERWREAVLPYVGFFNKDSSNGSLQLNWKNKVKDFIQIKKPIDNVMIKSDS